MRIFETELNADFFPSFSLIISPVQCDIAVTMIQDDVARFREMFKPHYLRKNYPVSRR